MKWLWAVPTILLLSCGEPPPIAKDLDLNIATSDRWPARLSQRFPPGTDEAEVVSTLQAQGFSVDEHLQTAKFKWSKQACDHSLEAHWRTDSQRRITSIEGTHWPACL